MMFVQIHKVHTYETEEEYCTEVYQVFFKN